MSVRKFKLMSWSKNETVVMLEETISVFKLEYKDELEIKVVDKDNSEEDIEIWFNSENNEISIYGFCEPDAMLVSINGNVVDLS